MINNPNNPTSANYLVTNDPNDPINANDLVINNPNDPINANNLVINDPKDPNDVTKRITITLNLTFSPISTNCELSNSVNLKNI